MCLVPLDGSLVASLLLLGESEAGGKACYAAAARAIQTVPSCEAAGPVPTEGCLFLSAGVFFSRRWEKPASPPGF